MRVLELAGLALGPFAGMTLADHGAETGGAIRSASPSTNR
ncbi:CoA transferase [Nonomuraea sp. NPDC049152]